MGDSNPPGSPHCCLELERVVEAVQQLSLARDVGRIAEIVRHEARQLTGADGASFVLREADSCYYVDEEAISPLWKGQRFPADACVSGWAMNHRQPVAIEDVYADPRVPVEAYRPTFVKSMLMVPIRVAQPIGAIGNYWAHRHQPSREETRLLQALADTTAVALENVLLHSDLEKRVRERTAVLTREIGEHKQVEYALEARREHLSLAFKAGHSGIFEWDARTNTCTWSDELLALYGLEAFGGRYEDWLNCVLPEDREGVKDTLRQGRQTGEVEQEFRIRRRGDGAVRWMLGRAEILLDDARRPCRMIGIQMDITEHRQAEEQMRQQAMLLEMTPDPTMVWDTGQGIRFWNRGCEQLYGYPRQEALGQSVQTLLKTVFPISQEACMGELKTTGRWSGELRHTARDGRQLVVESWMRRLAIEGRSVILEATREITERKAAEAEIQRLNTELEERVRKRTAELERANEALLHSNTELRYFAHAAAHDLQTPLRSIASFAQLLKRATQEYGNEQVDQWSSLVIDNTKRLQGLIQDLLAYTRLEAQGLPFKPVELREVADEVLASLRLLIDETGAEIHCGPLPTVAVDRLQIAQLLQNLLENGIKYNQSKPPRITIACDRREDQWVFSVADNGIGIDRRHHERIFEIFRRLHTYSRVPGTGIGLALCRRIVERHGGRIWVESELGKGCVFYFSLPLRRERPHETRTRGPVSGGGSSGGG